MALPADTRGGNTTRKQADFFLRFDK